jgi:D-xylose transport system permease protein
MRNSKLKEMVGLKPVKLAGPNASGPSVGGEAVAEGRGALPWRNLNLRPYTMLLALVVIALFFQLTTDGTFLNARNSAILIRQMSITGIITVGVVLLIISGNFDLAVGSTVALTGGIAAVLQVWYHWPTLFCLLAAVLCGVLVGAWQGFWVAYRKVPSFIVTLGGMMMFRGIYLVITDGITITPLSKDFTVLAQGFVPASAGLVGGALGALALAVSIIRGNMARKKYGFKLDSPAKLGLEIVLGCALIALFVMRMNNYLGIPIPVVVLLALILIFWFVSKRTQFGRNLYAIGGNADAARFSGISIEKNTLWIFIIVSALAAISGILLTARLDGATASAGTAFEMDAIAACVIGGTSLRGGQGSIFAAMVGALIMASLDNGMSLMNTSSYFQYIVKGLVLIVAVWFDVSARHGG